MRTCYFIVTTLLAGALQTSHAQHLQVGLKLGASVSRVTGVALYGLPTFWVAGPAGGLVARVPVAGGGRWAVQAEALYGQYGYRRDYVYGGYTPYDITRLHCLDMPLLAQWRWQRLLVEAGPQLQLVLDATESSDVNRQSITNAVRRVGFGYAAGVGGQLGSRTILGVRFQQNLTPLYRFGATSPNNNGLRTYAVQVQGTYYLNTLRMPAR